MTRIPVVAILLFAPFCALAADDLKVSQLEQDVRNLQRQLQAQGQQLEQLRRQLAGVPDQPRPPPAAAAAVTGKGDWVDAAKWQRVRAGMTELEVIGLLGAPTSMRNGDGERRLLYAMEIGATAFLSGSVTLRERAVTSVQIPVLK